VTPFVPLAFLIVTGFLIAGGARDDILSLLLWRPITAIVFALALAWSGRDAWRNGKALSIYAGAIAALVLMHTIPLPPDIWVHLPGRQFLVGLYRDMGMALPWQPLSMTPARTWNALFSLFGPLAAMLLAFSLNSRQHRRLLRTIIVLGAVSGLLGLMQAIGPVNGPLYLYNVTNFGDGVGLFANRNHQAVFMAAMFPLLAAHLSLWTGRPDRLLFQRVLVAAAAVFLVPLLLVTGSRAGVILGIVGIVLAWWTYSPPVPKGRRATQGSVQRVVQIGLVAFLAAASLSLMVLAARAPALSRLLSFDGTAELRIQAFPTVLRAAWDFFPVGSGIGSFVETYEIYEPDALLSSAYLNHAHDDYLEVFLTAGLPGALLLAAGAAIFAWAVVKLMRAGRSGPEQSRTPLVLGRTGSSILILLALSSATDYPLRVPAMALLASVCAVWVVNALGETAALRVCRSHEAATVAAPSLSE
jgi:O-antigen ligase